MRMTIDQLKSHLASCMSNAGISQAEMARTLGVGRNYVNRALSDTGTDKNLLIRIAQQFGLEVEQLPTEFEVK